MCLQRCNADSKKPSILKSSLYFALVCAFMFQMFLDLGREQFSVIENSREVIKLVDYFVSKNNRISEKLITSKYLLPLSWNLNIIFHLFIIFSIILIKNGSF